MFLNRPASQSAMARRGEIEALNALPLPMGRGLPFSTTCSSQIADIDTSRRAPFSGLDLRQIEGIRYEFQEVLARPE